MKNNIKKEILKNRLTNLKDCLEVAGLCINSALENLSNLDEIDELSENLEFYTKSIGSYLEKQTVKSN